MPGSPAIAISSGDRVRATRSNVVRSPAHLLGAADERAVELAPDRRGVGVDMRQHVAAAGGLGRVGPVAHEPPRRLVHPDLSGGRRAREPFCRAHGPADHRAVERRDHLTRADAAARPYPERQALRACHELGGRAQRALRVVLVRNQRAEDHQDRVAAELRSGAAVALADCARRVVVALDHGAQGLGVELVACDELRERARDQPPRVDGERRGRMWRRAGRGGDALAEDRGLELAQVR
jgi:hypothetical protein